MAEKEHWLGERMTIQPYEEWKREKLKGWAWRVEKAKSERGFNKDKIKWLEKEIKSLREEIKEPLPERPDTTIEAYEIAKEEAKKEAKERGWEWVEP